MIASAIPTTSVKESGASWLRIVGSVSLVIICIISRQPTGAQDASPVLTAEKSFARLARESGMRNAFLKNLDSNGVIFQAGNIYNGIQQFTATKESSIKLLWHPVYACMSFSGDIGFTTGPYEVRKTMTTGVLAAGQYSSIWKKNSAGEWKLLVDLGTDYTSSLYNNTLSAVSFSALYPVAEGDLNFETIEADFIKSFNEKGVAAFMPLITEGSWFNLQSLHPLTGTAAIIKALEAVPRDLTFKPAGSGTSAAKDLVYVYGTIVCQGKKENYLRIWAHTKSGWMLLLQVLKW